MAEYNLNKILSLHINKQEDVTSEVVYTVYFNMFQIK